MFADADPLDPFQLRQAARSPVRRRDTSRSASLLADADGTTLGGQATHGPLLVLVDASAASDRLLERLADHAFQAGVQTVHLASVQEPVCAWQVKHFRTPAEIEAWQRMRADAILTRARARLEAAGVRCVCHVRIGPLAPSLSALAHEAGCDRILLPQASPLRRWLFRHSRAARALRTSPLPVLLVQA